MLDRKLWIVIPIILLASVPITLFGLMQFPLLAEISISTYLRKMFDTRKSNADTKFLMLCNLMVFSLFMTCDAGIYMSKRQCTNFVSTSKVQLLFLFR